MWAEDEGERPREFPRHFSEGPCSVEVELFGMGVAEEDLQVANFWKAKRPLNRIYC